MRIIRLGVLLGSVVITVGCSTPYMVDRKRDAADVFTLSTGEGLGVKTRVGPLQCGLGAWQDSWGLRNGEFTARGYSETLDIVLGAPLIENCAWGQDRSKDYHTSGVFLFSVPSRTQKGKLPAHYYTQLEINMGLWKSLRFGFNPGELLDFLLGWTTLDVYGDDIERRAEDQTK